MPAWREARTAGQRSRNSVQAKRAAGAKSTNVGLPLAAKRWVMQVCVYCGGKGGLRVGNLPISGNAYFCKKHSAQFYSDKAWEAKYKRQEGL